MAQQTLDGWFSTVQKANETATSMMGTRTKMAAAAGKQPEVTPSTNELAANAIESAMASIEGSSRKGQSALKADCLRRDNNRCVITGLVNRTAWKGMSLGVHEAREAYHSDDGDSDGMGGGEEEEEDGGVGGDGEPSITVGEQDANNTDRLTETREFHALASAMGDPARTRSALWLDGSRLGVFFPACKAFKIIEVIVEAASRFTFGIEMEMLHWSGSHLNPEKTPRLKITAEEKKRREAPDDLSRSTSELKLLFLRREEAARTDQPWVMRTPAEEHRHKATVAANQAEAARQQAEDDVANQQQQAQIVEFYDNNHHHGTTASEPSKPTAPTALILETPPCISVAATGLNRWHRDKHKHNNNKNNNKQTPYPPPPATMSEETGLAILATLDRLADQQQQMLDMARPTLMGHWGNASMALVVLGAAAAIVTTFQWASANVHVRVLSRTLDCSFSETKPVFGIIVMADIAVSNALWGLDVTHKHRKQRLVIQVRNEAGRNSKDAAQSIRTIFIDQIGAGLGFSCCFTIRRAEVVAFHAPR
ncbi:hypothetical protein CONLIGDRAFT_718018 [Coniochaeta ligniaria NRRL 30616]|uniref:Uncharacterized protein n=1 Tax=Coniochaeta ligniaria NRRL 30616 TaxID=1408157 RepID=A0A1J7ICG1_9PEZI|nr:hypothetical protein CONLIGDRAFT_718018 [Coniochaeta ligniaria NRRL 30616]